MRVERGGERKVLPKRVDGVNLAELPLSPIEAFVLSQLDGATELSEVAMVTCLDESEVRRTLERLRKLGVVHEGEARSGNTSHSSSGRRAFDPRRDEEDEGIPVEEHVRSNPRASEKKEIETGASARRGIQHASSRAPKG